MRLVFMNHLLFRYYSIRPPPRIAMMASPKPAPSSELSKNLNPSHILTEPSKTPLRDEGQKEANQIVAEAPTAYKKDLRFWAILFALCITSLLASLETTVVVTSLPTIVERLEFGSSYVWVGNIFFLTRLVSGHQPGYI